MADTFRKGDRVRLDLSGWDGPRGHPFRDHDGARGTVKTGDDNSPLAASGTLPGAIAVEWDDNTVRGSWAPRKLLRRETDAQH